MSKNIVIDPKIVEELLKFSRHISEAPKLVAAPDEIILETTDHDIVYKEDKVRLLHYKPISAKQYRTPLVISYALINRFHILDIHPKKELGQKFTCTGDLMCIWSIGAPQLIWIGILTLMIM